MSTNLFLVLAVRDICKSEFSEKESINNDTNNANASASNNNQRNIIRDEGFESTSYWHRQSSSRCLKFILKSINTKNGLENKAFSSNSHDLLIAFEFNGQIALPSANPKSLTGMILEIRGSLDLCRGILLLQADKCSFKAASTDKNTSTTANAYTHRPSLANDPIVLDEDILNEMVDDDLFEHNSFLETI